MNINYLQEGIEWLGYNSPFFPIDHQALRTLQYLEDYENRFKFPQGLTKKELKDLQKETQKKIYDYQDRVRKLGAISGRFWEYEREHMVHKKKKILATLRFHNNFGTMNIAKSYPIEELIDFKGGMAKCLWHNEKTGSLHHDKKRNKAHCFGACGKGYDSIDTYQKINNVDFSTAVKALS